MKKYNLTGMNAGEKWKALNEAGFRERYAMEHGTPTKRREKGEIIYKWSYSTADEYQDGNGAEYNATRGRWTN